MTCYLQAQVDGTDSRLGHAIVGIIYDMMACRILIRIYDSRFQIQDFLLRVICHLASSELFFTVIRLQGPPKTV